MKLLVSILTLGMMIPVSGCSDAEHESDTQPQKHVEAAADAAKYYVWPESRVEELAANARDGDIKAAQDLYSYHQAWMNEEEISKWELWLIDHGDGGAMAARASKAFTQALNLELHDPLRLELLQTAQVLMKRAKNAPIDPVKADHVLFARIDI